MPIAFTVNRSLSFFDNNSETVIHEGTLSGSSNPVGGGCVASRIATDIPIKFPTNKQGSIYLLSCEVIGLIKADMYYGESPMGEIAQLINKRTQIELIIENTHISLSDIPKERIIDSKFTSYSIDIYMSMLLQTARAWNMAVYPDEASVLNYSFVGVSGSTADLILKMKKVYNNEKRT